MIMHDIITNILTLGILFLNTMDIGIFWASAWEFMEFKSGNPIWLFEKYYQPVLPTVLKTYVTRRWRHLSDIPSYIWVPVCVHV